MNLAGVYESKHNIRMSDVFHYHFTSSSAAITCPPPEENSTGFGYYVMEGNMVGDTASFRCYDGYHSNELPHVVTCDPEGNWTGGEHPTCESKLAPLTVHNALSIQTA